MTETIFELVSQYGVYVIFASAFLSCLALPIPTSLMMLTGGAFIASGDLSVWSVAAAAFGGAVLGDQVGYLVGRIWGTQLSARLERSPSRAKVLGRARRLIDRRGPIGVFLSTWAVAPLGPWVNFVAGATGLSWARFSLGDILGEICWVLIYVGLGYVFFDQIADVADIMSDLIGLAVALVLAVGSGFWIKAILRARKTERHNTDQP
ncbi:DedA family protein [Cognatishimia sp. F0-27]|uniref:DedA family protein n=1 Tax=Cognatishimia sp. F0-27 TaxID=2816855 RepID=UPI001D0C64F5|nr:DedA family protein [Cognatishimia sp. F0-27]MCC1492046.1 DedA family protein [Cognatishimia sp. F0-27]